MADAGYDDNVGCALCDVAEGAAAATIYYDDGGCLAIAPLRSMAPVHVLLFPREHFDGLPNYLDLFPESAGRLMQRAAAIAVEQGLSESGYRLVWNFGPDTRQRIEHPHLHLLGGARLRNELA